MFSSKLKVTPQIVDSKLIIIKKHNLMDSVYSVMNAGATRCYRRRKVLQIQCIWNWWCPKNGLFVTIHSKLNLSSQTPLSSLLVKYGCTFGPSKSSMLITEIENSIEVCFENGHV